MENRKLSQNFTLFELTRTNRSKFQDLNRIISDVEIEKLTNLANLLEKVRSVFEAPIIVTSGYRCESLNLVMGSSDRSQHLKAEAADIIPRGVEVDKAFRRLWKEIEEGHMDVGQLIYEKAARGYGVSEWIHVSLGSPYRESSKCNQVLSMTDGNYRLVKNYPREMPRFA